ncbi:hypothetical protein AB2B38_009250 [Balneola sp. MJW-20]|uniref:hypothetical protein n=1 Tax=Gracilimonas aurantiaca TaxID=3234185 RepID=UPI0034670025
MKNLLITTILIGVLTIVSTEQAMAQFEEPVIEKVTEDQKAAFMQRFSDVKWTGQGFNYNSLDRMPAIEIRAKLQDAFGEPTQTVEDIIKKDGRLRDGKSIQFEYWFVIDGEIPMMILDLDGPFEDGLVWVGASRYIDLMPQVKRTLTKLVGDAQPKEYVDYFFSPERDQWFKVAYSGGKYTKEEIKQPDHIKL